MNEDGKGGARIHQEGYKILLSFDNLFDKLWNYWDLIL